MATPTLEFTVNDATVIPAPKAPKRHQNEALANRRYFFTHQAATEDFERFFTSMAVGQSWGTIRGDSSVANRRQNKGLWCSAMQLTAERSTIELPGNISIL